MTEAQRNLLHEAQLTGGKVDVSGPRVNVARNLERAGYGVLGVGGSGVAFSGRWWWQFQANERGMGFDERA